MLILITGANGTLGTAICEKLKDKHSILAPTSIYLDVRNSAQVMSYASKPIELIIHLAAETDHIACEFSPLEPYMTNTIGTQNMVDLAEKCDCPIAYLSTGGIFDGKKDFYVEKDKPNPINHYSKSKYFGEKLVGLYPKHFIFRTGWMMGGGPRGDKKFVNKIFKLIQEGSKSITAISDIYGSPTYACDLAELIWSLVNLCQFGTYHLVNGGVASRYDVAQEFINILGLKDKVIVHPQKFRDYYKTNQLLCPYTMNEVLKSTKINPMRHWREALKDYAEKDFCHVT